MFDVEWKPKDFAEKVKEHSCFGGYRHYSVSNREDVNGFCEWLRYQGATNIKVTKYIPYTFDTVKEARAKRGLTTTKTDKRNIQLVKKIACECAPGNIPYTPAFIQELAKEYDKTKPILICIGGDYYPLEHVYILQDEDLDENEKELAGCLVFDIE